MKAELINLSGYWKVIVRPSTDSWAYDSPQTGWHKSKAEALLDLSELVVQIHRAAQKLYDEQNVLDLSASAEEAVLIANGTEALPERFTLTEEDGILVQKERSEA